MIAYCGIVCSKCPVFIATQADDDHAKEEIARSWSRQYGIDMTPHDANCDGCFRTNGRLIGHCRACGIRACGIKKKVATCADCPDYACGQLKQFHLTAPHAGRMLEKLKSKNI